MTVYKVLRDIECLNPDLLKNGFTIHSRKKGYYNYSKFNHEIGDKEWFSDFKIDHYYSANFGRLNKRVVFICE